MNISTGVAAPYTPLRPPMMNIETNAMAFNMAVVNRMLPRHSVASQLNVLTLEGKAITIVATMNEVPSSGFMPLTNM